MGSTSHVWVRAGGRSDRRHGVGGRIDEGELGEADGSRRQPPQEAGVEGEPGERDLRAMRRRGDKRRSPDSIRSPAFQRTKAEEFEVTALILLRPRSVSDRITIGALIW